MILKLLLQKLIYLLRLLSLLFPCLYLFLEISPIILGICRIKHWERIMGETINGKTIGVVGLGKIGKRLVELASGLI
jgi:hypothetical protein